MARRVKAGTVLEDQGGLLAPTRGTVLEDQGGLLAPTRGAHNSLQL